MSGSRQFRQDALIPHGTTAQSNLKMTDIIPVQHEDLASNVNQMNKISIGQCLCEPYAVCNSNNPENGAYVADCVNFPDFALSFTDGQGNSHALVGLKIRVLFTHGITYGSVSGNTYPTLNINNSGAIPLLAQGKTMGAGAISAGQTAEFTVIPYGNGLAFDADSNVREATSDYVINTDGSITYTVTSYKTKRLIPSVTSKAGLFEIIKNSNNNYCGMLDTVMIANPATDFMLGTLIFVRLEDRGMAKGIFYTMYNQTYNFLTFYAYDVNNEHFFLQDFDGNVVLKG